MEERRERRQNKGIVGSGAALPTGATSGLKQTRQILLHCYAHRLRGSPQNARRFCSHLSVFVRNGDSLYGRDYSFQDMLSVLKELEI